MSEQHNRDHQATPFAAGSIPALGRAVDSPPGRWWWSGFVAGGTALTWLAAVIDDNLLFAVIAAWIVGGAIIGARVAAWWWPPAGAVGPFLAFLTLLWFWPGSSGDSGSIVAAVCLGTTFLTMLFGLFGVMVGKSLTRWEQGL